MNKFSKKAEQKVKGLQRENENNLNFEYALIGFVAPEFRWMLTLVSVGMTVGYLSWVFFSINVVYCVIVMLVIIYIGLQLMYVDAYVAKNGKRLFFYSKGFLRKEILCVSPISSCQLLEEGSDSAHINVNINLEGRVTRITLKYDNDKTSLKNKNMEQFIQDINKKKK